MSAYRYFRLVTKGRTYRDAFNPIFIEVRLYTGSGQTGTEFAVGGTATASHDYVFSPGAALDNNYGTYWHGGTEGVINKWWQVDTLSEHICRSFSIYAYGDASGLAMPRSFELQTSKNGDFSNPVLLGIYAADGTGVTVSTWFYRDTVFNYFQNSVIPNIIVY